MTVLFQNQIHFHFHFHFHYPHVDMSPTKILIIGPKGSGKSTIGTFLADIKDSLQPGKSYEPTYGVRILEKYNVEFYDCSGDQIFEGCWRSIMMGADGVIIVFNPDVPGHEQQLSEWASFNM